MSMKIRSVTTPALHPIGMAYETVIDAAFYTRFASLRNTLFDCFCHIYEMGQRNLASRLTQPGHLAVDK